MQSAQDSAPIREPDRIPSSPEGALPAHLTPLIGRTQEIERVSRILRENAARLLVLTGPGGVGKTRLALAVAEVTEDAYPDGVVLVNLGPLSSSEQVLPTIAGVLGVRDRAGEQPYQTLREEIQHRTMLLVLDNFEQVVRAAPVLTDLLTHSHGLTILVTSRSVLGVYGEFVYPVPPMHVPVPDSSAFEEIEACEAVQLFVSRVRAIHPGFCLTRQNAMDIATICTRLDGLPLAIELAAPRTNLFTVSSLARRLDHRLSLLRWGPRNVPDRQQTMRNAISWSYELLTPLEQAVFRRLAIFVGRWDVEAAQSLWIPGDDAGLQAEADLFDAIGSLVDKSLIHRTISSDHDRHFSILQTLREFGLEELDRHGEREEAERLHTAYMLALAKRAAPHLTGREQVFWLDQLDMVYVDFQAVFNRIIGEDPPEQALELATALWRAGYTRGHIVETRGWLDQALERATEPTVLRAQALNGAGVLANMEGNFRRTRACHEEAVAIGRALNDTLSMALALFGLGDMATLAEDIETAEASYLEAERLYVEMGDARGIATAQTNLGNLYWGLGRLDDALKINEAAWRLYESVGDQRGVAWSVTNVGRLAAELGDQSRAFRNLAHAMELYDMLGDRSGIAESLEGFASVSFGTGDPSRAATLLAAADRLRQAISHPVPQNDMPTYGKLKSSIEEQLGQEFDIQWSVGASMMLDDAMSLALALTLPDDGISGPQIGGAASLRAIAEKGITERELQVLQKLGSGESDKEIAASLYISVRTVQSHVQNLLNKFGVSSRSAAVASAFREGILQ